MWFSWIFEMNLMKGGYWLGTRKFMPQSELMIFAKNQLSSECRLIDEDIKWETVTC